MDFFKIVERSQKRGIIEIYPDFSVHRHNDLMVRGKSFYAIWDQEAGLWSTDEYDVQRLVDQELYAYKDRMPKVDGYVTVKAMGQFSSGVWLQFQNYLKNIPNCSKQLDTKLTFANTKVKKTDYVSKRLPYPLEEGDYSSFEELISTLYDPEERAKLEWAIGSIVDGASIDIQKFIVLYGDYGAGKSTILNIIQKLFAGYFTTFDAKSLTSTSNAFSTEVFKTNPLVAIQHDGDLSRIEDNTKLNSIVSHELMTMNEKYKPSYTARANCFLFMATNKPVKITDGKSGIIRRLIDVKPSGRKLTRKRYDILMNQIDFELGAIAWHCREVFRQMGKDYYSSYKPLDMIFKTDPFFNFVEYKFDEFASVDGISLTRAYDIYTKYYNDGMIDFKLPRHKFREELKNYFEFFDDVTRVDGKQVRSWYHGFLTSKFTQEEPKKKPEKGGDDWLSLDCDISILDKLLADCQAQYASDAKTPLRKWSNVTTRLSDLDTSKLHYVRVPLNHIVIDFDLKDDKGEKSAEKNLEAASKWPKTYTEFSQGGQGLHLHYIYQGDPLELATVYDEGIEVKVFVGSSALRRRLTKCNNLPVSTISSGLKTKGAKRKVNSEATIKSEQGLRKMIFRNLKKEIHPSTKCSIDFIEHILNEAYESGMAYDVSDMFPAVLTFANNSTHHAEECVKKVSEMRWKSTKEIEDVEASPEASIIFFDCEVFPNLFLINWKYEDSKTVVRMINPSPEEVGALFRFRMIGFNCRRYDNHILYARYMGYSIEGLYRLSQKIIVDQDPNAMFPEAYNISYTDVYDFSSKKQSLKKFEIELGIHHQELGLPWDQPVPESMWTEVAEYCDNDVIATEAVFKAREADWKARKILSALSGLTVNSTTNQHTTRIIFGTNRTPQNEFNYRFLGDTSCDPTCDTFAELYGDSHSVFINGKAVFPGYLYDHGKSTYWDVCEDNPDPEQREVGEGGYVYAEKGIYRDVALLDIASMHPASLIAENLFGDYTKRFQDIRDARVAIKHKDFEKARTMLDGKLAPFLEDDSDAGDLANALKIAINSVYGLTSAKFVNPFRDPRNVDNIVAKRGALFMINLRHMVKERGFTVAHIKTDSIKIPNATPEIIQFVMDYGKAYGYSFEHEATYDRMCLVNNAVYIAQYASSEKCQSLYGYIPGDNSKHPNEWTATGAEFQHPYIFKTLFSKEDVEFSDLCETKQVSTSIYLDMNEQLPDVSVYEKDLDKLLTKKKKGDQVDEAEVEALKNDISKGHKYEFVGRIGSFCPIKPNCGGGVLVREKDGKYYSISGTKGWKWLESEKVRFEGREEDVDMRYFEKLASDAKEHIAEFGSYDEFVSGV